MAGFNMDDYVDVAQRIHEFYERFPEGRLTTGSPPYMQHVEGGKSFIVYHAQAYRTPDDPNPGDGWAWEPVPGPTQFTKDSELQNAETAAWGRAIVALGFATKKIASKQEVQNRQGSDKPAVQQTTNGASNGPALDPATFVWTSGKQQGKTLDETPGSYIAWYAENGPKQDVREMCQRYEAKAAAEIDEANTVMAGMVAEDDIPFRPTIDGLGN